MGQKQTVELPSVFTGAWNDLPDQIIIKIFTHLDAHEIAKVARVNKRMKKLAYNEIVWGAVYSRKYGEKSSSNSKSEGRLDFRSRYRSESEPNDANMRKSRSMPSLTDKKERSSTIVIQEHTPKSKQGVQQKSNRRCCQGGGSNNASTSSSAGTPKSPDPIHIKRNGSMPSFMGADLGKGIKVCLLGEANAGKSSLIARYVHDNYIANPPPTVGAAFFGKLHTIKGGPTIKYEIWDTAGQERFYSVAPLYYRGSSVAIIVFDITSKRSFDKAKKWLDDLRQGISTSSIIVVIVGTKLDIEDHRDVDISTARHFAEDNGCLYMECSARSGKNVTELFEMIGRELIRSSDVYNNEAFE